MVAKKSLKHNTIANYIGLIYTTIIGIVVFPLYLQFLGAEAFGLVGFFVILQAWVVLFSLGMSPMLARQVAKTRGQNADFIELKKLLKSLELIFLFIALIVGFSIATASDWIANNWLKVSLLDVQDVGSCIVLMGIIVGMGFFSSLYRSGIQGMENQVRLNVVNVILATVKSIGALLLLAFITQDIVDFFIYQLVIAVFELMILSIMFYKLMPETTKVRFGFYWKIFKPIIPFAGGIAYTAVVWVLLTQLDKMILSGVLSLAEYGYFALVAIVSAGVLSITTPISNAILPRMTYLLSQGKEREMLELYRKSTQLMAVVMFPLTGMIALFSTELIFAWTGDRHAAEWAGPILFWFVLGNGILTIGAFQYYLQFAHGKLKMHVVYSTVSAIIQVPIIIYVALEHGALGVALTWFFLRVITFIIWTPIVHSKFAPNIHWPWLLKDIAPIFISTITALVVVNNININFENMERMQIFLVLIVIGLVLLVINAFVSSAVRRIVFAMVNNNGGKINAG